MYGWIVVNFMGEGGRLSGYEEVLSMSLSLDKDKED